jgi:hypothetical protein
MLQMCWSNSLGFYQEILGFLALEDKTDKLFRKVGTELTLYAE